MGGLYVGDDSAKLVTDADAGKAKDKGPVLPWDMPVEDVPEERMMPKIEGVVWDDIAEETIKKGKEWQKFWQRQEKKSQDLAKNQEKEKSMLQKSQKAQYDKKVRESTTAKQNKIKEREKKPGETKEQMEAFIKKLDENVEKEIENMKKQQMTEGLRIERIHRTEKHDIDKADLKENFETLKKLKKEAQEKQVAAFEAQQKKEQDDLAKTIEGKKADQAVKLAAEIKDKDELAKKTTELDEKCCTQIANQTKKIKNTQEIRREQLLAEHKEQLNMLNQKYLKTLKASEEDHQSEIEKLESDIQAIGFIEQ